MNSGFRLMIGVVLLMTGALLAQAPERPAHNFANGQKVEIKSQRDWKAVTIVKRTGDWYLVSHERTNWREWVEYWRIRRLRTTTDELPPIQSHGFIRNDEGPPTAKVAPKPPAGDKLSWASERVKSAQDLDAPPAPPGANVPNAPGAPAAPAALDVPAPGAPNTPPDAPPARTLEIDPATVPALKLDPVAPVPLPAQPRIALKGPPIAAELDRIVIASGAKQLLLGFAEPWRGSTPSRGFVERVDLQTGRSVEVIELSPGTKLLDASDDGSICIAARTGGQDDRLDLWASTDGKMVARFGFNPFAADKWPNNRIQSAVLSADGSRLLVSNGWSKVVCLDAQTAAPIWEKPIRGNDPLALDAARKHAVFDVEGKQVYVSLVDGALVGKVDLPSSATHIFSRSPEGTRLFRAAGSTLHAFSLNDQPAPEPVTLTSPISQIVALDRSILLVNAEMLVDIDRGVILASISAEQTKGLTIAPDGSAVYAVATGKGQVSCHPLVDAALRDRVTDPASQVALKPGDTVRVSYDLQCSPELHQPFRDNAAKAIAAAGLKVADAGGVHLIYKSVPGESREVTFRRMHAREQESTNVVEQVTTVTIELDGQPIWTGGSTFGGQGFLQLKEGQSLADAINVARNSSTIAAGATAIPKRLLKPVGTLSLPEIKLPR